MIAAPLRRLRIRQLAQVVLRQAGDERAEIRVLEDVGVGVLLVERTEHGCCRLDRLHVNRIGGEATLELTDPKGSLGRRDSVRTKPLENRIGRVKQPIHAQPDRLDLL
jgi:hypothetical protein